MRVKKICSKVNQVIETDEENNKYNTSEQHETSITQNNALQMIFDLKFLNVLFESTTKDDASSVRREIDRDVN